MDFRTLNKLIKSGMDYAHRRIRAFGLSDTECLICSFINTHSGCSQDDVANGLHTDKTTTAKALSKLEAKGYVIRDQHQLDRLKKVLTLTETGKERISEIMNLHDEWLNDVLGTLSASERRRFEGYCARLLDAAEEKLEQGEPKKNHGTRKQH